MMKRSTLFFIIQFLSNHFEQIILVIGSFLIMVVAVYGMVRLKFVLSRKKNVQSFLEESLVRVILIVVVALAVSVQYLYWINYGPAGKGTDLGKPFSFDKDTTWIREPIRIYYVVKNELRSIGIHGLSRRAVFRADDDIQEYRFSPNGRYLLVLTPKSLFLIDRLVKKVVIPETISGDSTTAGIASTASAKIRGAITGLQWAPDNRKFCYQVARWSDFSSQDHAYVYDIPLQKKFAIKNVGRKITSLTWDQDGRNLYYFLFEAKDTALYVYPFEVKVFRIPLKTLTPEVIGQIPYQQRQIPVHDLEKHGIYLFIDGERLAFSEPPDAQWVSEKKQQLGIDDEGFLYFVRNEWFRQRLFRLPEQSQALVNSPYHVRDFLVDQIRWLPGGRYAIMRHRYFGFLILEPAEDRVGLLPINDATAVGWFDPSVEHKIRGGGNL